MPEVDQSSCLLEADLEPGPILSSLLTDLVDPLLAL